VEPSCCRSTSSTASAGILRPKKILPGLAHSDPVSYALGQDETWTKAQSELIEKLAAEVEEKSFDDPERLEVADALRRSLHRVGLRQGVLRVLSRLDLDHLRKEWDRLYGLRSGVFHGTSELTEPELSQLAMDVVSLCGRIILAIVERDGVKLPSIANVHFRGA
jgi:hypothetical protein